jgi:hypothetical protein
MRTHLPSLYAYCLLLKRQGVKNINVHDIPIEQLQLMPS